MLLLIEPITRNAVLIVVVIVLLLIMLYIDAKKSQLKILKLFRKDSFETLEAKFLSVDETINAIIAINTDGIITFANKAVENLFKWDKKAILHNNITILIPERFRKAHLEGMKKYKETGQSPLIGKTKEFLALRSDNIEVPVALTIKEVVTDSHKFFVGVIRDLSGEKEREYLNNEQFRFFKDTIKLLEETERVGKVGGWVWDIREKRVETTKGFREIFGTVANEAPMDYFMRRVAEKDQQIVRDALDKAFNKENYSISYRVIRPNDNTVAFVDCDAEPILDSDGVVTHIYGIIKLNKITKYTDAGF